MLRNILRVSGASIGDTFRGLSQSTWKYRSDWVSDCSILERYQVFWRFFFPSSKFSDELPVMKMNLIGGMIINPLV